MDKIIKWHIIEISMIHQTLELQESAAVVIAPVIFSYPTVKTVLCLICIGHKMLLLQPFCCIILENSTPQVNFFFFSQRHIMFKKEGLIMFTLVCYCIWDC